jgi:hypothetical protein
VWWSLRGSFVPGSFEKRKLTRSEGPFERGKGLKKTRPLWPPQRGVGLREPNLGKTNPCVSLLYLPAICFATSLADLIIFLTLTQLVVVINFVNFSFALFTLPLGDFQQATQVYYLSYACQTKEHLKGWDVVYKVSPHGRLPTMFHTPMSIKIVVRCW